MISRKPQDGDRYPSDADVPLTIEQSSKLIDRLRRIRIPFLVALHLVAFCLIYWAAIFIRFERLIPENQTHLLVMPLVVFIKLAVFYTLRTFHGWWRYVTFSDFVRLSQATAVAVAVFFVIDALLIDGRISRGVILIDAAFTIAVMGALRSCLRAWDERSTLFGTHDKNRMSALLIGSDLESAKLAHLINSRSNLDYRIAGLVAIDDVDLKRYSDLRVVGRIEDVNELCSAVRAKTVFVPSGRLVAKDLRKLIDVAAKESIQIRVIPSMMTLLEGGEKIPLRQVSFDDLLRRPPVRLNQNAIQDLIADKRVLVTGAGGSIGSELCRQLLKFEPDQLVLLGRGENRLYHIHRELKADANGTELHTALANITDEKRMRQIFEQFRPEVVFHAAAHKHVPMTELNIGEAVINNVYGSKVVADICNEYSVEKCVVISTDKAVNPTSIMGCTKQLAERYCLALGTESSTRFVVTRFGNVLGSEGSVVPLFKEQIQSGGPITVTDPRMTRFFMTIPEASQLVIQSATMGKGGEIFVLEMGEPVKILDLAKDLIRLSGLPADSIDIDFTGIRQGEKLYEELYYLDEKSLPTEHEKILTAFHRPFDLFDVEHDTNQLIDMAYDHPDKVREELQRQVPEFKATAATGANEARNAAGIKS